MTHSMTTAIDPLLFGSAHRAPSPHGRPRRQVRAPHPSRPVVASARHRSGHGALSVVARRRLAIALVAVVAFVSAFAVLNSMVSADGNDLSHTEVPRTVIAQPGDTIWAIARRVMPEGNINSLVDQLVKLNGATITVGQSIRIP